MAALVPRAWLRDPVRRHAGRAAGRACARASPTAIGSDSTCSRAAISPIRRWPPAARRCSSQTGPHAYISPEWYGLEDRVPTWNYVAVELEGPVRALDPDALIRLVDDLSAEQEARLAPKVPWTPRQDEPRPVRGPAQGDRRLRDGRSRSGRGTAKIDQDKPETVRGGASPTRSPNAVSGTWPRP